MSDEKHNQKILIVTGTSDILRKDYLASLKDSKPDEIDFPMLDVFDATLKSKQLYAQKYNYDLMLLYSFGEDPNGIFHHYKLGILRVLRCIQFLNYYDTVMWIDADSLITNDSYKIEDFEIDNEHCFYCSWDWNGKFSLSTGNFILHKTKKLEQFNQLILSVGKYVVDNGIWGEEQTTVNIISQQPNSQNMIKVLDHKYLNSSPPESMFSEIGVNRSPIPYPWTDESFLIHVTGLTNKHRLQILNKHFKEKLS